MREDTNEVSANEMLLIFESNPVNEGLARVTAASFCTQLNPTLEEIADLKTAVSEAVTNSQSKRRCRKVNFVCEFRNWTR